MLLNGSMCRFSRFPQLFPTDAEPKRGDGYQGDRTVSAQGSLSERLTSLLISDIIHFENSE